MKLLYIRLIACFAAVLTASAPVTLCAIEFPEKVLDNEVAIRTVLGAQVDLGLQFRDSDGNQVTLADVRTAGRPLVIVPVYFHCPRMCGLVHEGVIDLLNQINLTLGKEFFVVSVSFDPDEGPPLAKERADALVARLNAVQREEGKQGWRFLTGGATSIDALMNQVGFKYKRDGTEFAHSAAIMILTPDGKISQYFTGVRFSAWDVRLALIEASMGGIGSAIDHFLLYCFRFDPTQGRYTWAVYNIMRVLGVLTLVFLGTVIYRATRKSATALQGE